MEINDDQSIDNTPIIFKLIKAGDIDGLRNIDKFNINQVFNHDTLITYAIQNSKLNKYSIVKFLIKAGCDVNVPNQNTHETPLIYLSSSFWDCDLARLILENGAKINTLNLLSNSALCQTVFSYNFEMLELLAEFHADFNLQNSSGNTVFHALVSYTADSEFEDITNARQIERYISRLFKFGARHDIPNSEGLMPLELSFPGHNMIKMIIRNLEDNYEADWYW